MATHITPRDIRWYVRLAKKTANLRSNRQLSVLLSGSHGMVAHWEKMAQFEGGRGFPTESTMKRLADLCGVPEQLALFDRLCWITNDDAAREVLMFHASTIWDRMVAQGHPATKQPTYSFSSAQFAHLMMAAVLIGGTLMPPQSAHAAVVPVVGTSAGVSYGNDDEPDENSARSQLYIMKRRRRLRRRVTRRPHVLAPFPPFARRSLRRQQPLSFTAGCRLFRTHVAPGKEVVRSIASR